MTGSILHMSCVVLLGARAMAFNAGGLPFGDLLPFVNNPQSTDKPPKNYERKSFVLPHEVTEAIVKEQKRAQKAEQQAEAVVASELAKLRNSKELMMEALTRTRTATPLVTPPKAGNHPTKLLTASAIAKLITQKEGLLKSSSIAMDNYAKALADAQAIVQERKRTAKYGEQAVMAVETELIKLRNAKQDMMEATKMDINRSPLDPAYKVSRSNVSKAEAHVLAAEKRVGKANGRAVSLGEEAKAAAARLQQSLADKAKYKEEMRTALTSAQGLDTLLMESLEQHRLQTQKLVGRVAVLERQDAALASAMDDANNAPTMSAIRDATSAITAAGTQRSVAEPSQDPHATASQYAPAKGTSSTPAATEASSDLIAEETSSNSAAKETTSNSA